VITESPGVSIRRIPGQELPAVVDLARACWGPRATKARSLEWWRWRYFGSSPSLSEIRVVEQAGRLVGVVGMGFFRYALQKRTITGAVFTDGMVHPEYGRKGIFSALVSDCVQEAWRRGADFISAMPNDKSYPAVLKLGWIDLGDRDLLVCPLRESADVGKRPGRTWISLMMTIPAVVAEMRRTGVPCVRTATEEVERFDSGADVLSDTLGVNANRLALHRDSAWLNWRYCEKPGNEYRRFVARTRDGAMSGIAVTKLEKRFGIRAGFLVELVTTSTEVRHVLVRVALRSLREQGAEAVATVLSDNEVAGDLRKLGFFLVPRPLSPKRFHTAFLPRPENKNLLASCREVSRWYLTLGDWTGL